jgi:hypothetical protein
MLTCKYFPGKTFSSKADLFSHLRANVNKIISVKTSEIYDSHKKGAVALSFIPNDGVTKSFNGEAIKSLPGMKDGYIYPIINTTRYMDSHDDVHFDGTFKRSAKDQNGKLYYVADHEIKIGSIIAWPEDVNVMLKQIPWTFVNKNYPGTTEALIYEIDKNKIVHEKAYEIIREKRPVQNSVRMVYITVKLGMNSNKKEDIEYKNYYEKRIKEIVNSDVVEDQGYFFGVEEAKIIKEGSMVILGSNDATSVQQKEADTITSYEIEPPIPGTPKLAASSTRIAALNNLLSLTKNVK